MYTHYTRIHVCVHIRLCATVTPNFLLSNTHTYTHTHIRTQITHRAEQFIKVFMRLCVYVYVMHAHTFVCVRLYWSIHVHVSVCVYVCIYIYIYIACMHACTHTHTYTQTPNTLRHMTHTSQVSRGLIQVGPLSIDLPIKGTGQQRVLFADSRLRVFQSINPGSNWESEGLVVVQIPETVLAAL